MAGIFMFVMLGSVQSDCRDDTNSTLYRLLVDRLPTPRTIDERVPDRFDLSLPNERHRP